ncbi:MAG: electron transport complex subunit RsxC [Gammaproteobacteria bacterium]|nr:electron transport complex subunit RsxC [Gammaproteobacteria bacterium]
MGFKLWQFHGGLRLQGHKKQSMHEAVVKAAIPSILVHPLQQHIGEPAQAVVEVGDHVLKGQLIADFKDHIGAPVHSSTSGSVIAIEERLIPHASGFKALCIVIEADGKDTAFEYPTYDHTELEAEQLRDILRDAGIVGLGGAGFPTYVKLYPGNKHVVDTLILNGAECEPYITCDAMLMQEQPRKIIEGLLIMQHALQARHCVIAIEDNKRAAHTMLVNALKEHEAECIDIIQVPTIYPTGGEKQLIKIITGKEIAARARPIHKGVLCHNVATAAATRDALDGKPLISRIITITGDAVKQPRNMEVRLGTSFKTLLDECGIDRSTPYKLIMGGPLMGTAIHSEDVPVIKTTNCILSLKLEDSKIPTMPCIRCGECAKVCPANLLPQQLYWYARAKDFDRIQDYNLFDCIECGCCAYVCPSKIPLVNYYRFAKNEIWTQEQEKEKSDAARERHEFRQFRMERKKKEDEERKRLKKELLKKTTGQSDDKDNKKAAIEAAMARVKAKKEQQKKNVDDLTDAQKKAIADVDARRKQPKQATSDSNESSDK